MTITTIKTPNRIIMSLTPELNKHEFLMTLILVNGCCHKFYENKTDIYLAETFITKNILMSDSLKHYIKKTTNSLIGRKIICDNNKQAKFVLFEEIEKLKDGRYFVRLHKDSFWLLNNRNDYTLFDGNLMKRLNTIDLLKFYCLMKRWADYGNYHCYVEWLKWYLNVKNMETYIFLHKYILKITKYLNKHNFKLQITKCNEDEKDRKRVTKLIINVFDTYKELLNEGI